jgi:hypothetical protein
MDETHVSGYLKNVVFCVSRNFHLPEIGQVLGQSFIVVSKHLHSLFHHLHQKRGVECETLTLKQFIRVRVNINGKSKENLDLRARFKKTAADNGEVIFGLLPSDLHQRLTFGRG